MSRRFIVIGVCLIIAEACAIRGAGLFATEAPPSAGLNRPSVTTPPSADRLPAKAPPLADTLGVKFVDGSTSTVMLSRGGKEYLLNLSTHAISEVQPAVAMAPQGNQKALLASHSAGLRIFETKCSACHGTDGKGNAAMRTPDFTAPNVQGNLTDQDIVTVIENGKRGTAMPAWGGKLSEQDIEAVAEYVRFLGNQSHPLQLQPKSPQEGKKQKPKIYEPGDDVLVTLPTGRRLDRHGFYINFAHRFAFDPAFSGPARGGALLGLDGFAIPSFGLRYGVTDKLSVSVFREPSIIARPIQFMAAYNLLDEHDGKPLNIAVRFSIEGENDFLKNYTENFEGILSRSLTSHAQFYLVPTISLNDRPLQEVFTYRSRDILDLPGHNAFSLGSGMAVDIRPTVALLAEVIPTLVNGRPLGIHRPAYAFGIQKKIWRHSFTFGFTNSPGVTVSQRAATRASFLGDPGADKPGGLFIGFDLTREIY
ncbi:MAG: DUF5777 family beta-barrel protein [Terriglobia bacterium]